MDFDSLFEALTGRPPFPWQRALYHRFLAGDIPNACILPTGLGKTMTLAVWLLALANDATKVPRRLVYVVNRRTVVDQSTTEAEKLRKALSEAPALDLVRAALLKLCGVKPIETHGLPLAISTLRGQFADNEEWRTDPARPAIICGTVDMIGSRLLFSGYRCGFKTRPLHAGLLGHGSLLIHDEAHLEPAFQKLLDAIVEEQKGHREEAGRFHVMQLTATTRGSVGTPFELTAEDRENATVKSRFEAKKSLRLQVADEKETADKIADFAKKEHGQSGKAILIFARTVDSVEKIAAKLGKNVQTLTGTMRGKERDALARSDRLFARFLPEDDRKGREVAPGTVYLVCTSAGEVGVNISADHLVCDLSPFDSMAQRFGRVNRFGVGEALIDVFHPKAFESKAKSDKLIDQQKAEFEGRREATLSLLRRLDHDASPRRLSELPSEDRGAAFTPTPVILPVSDILFDAWSLTTIRERLPGRPPVEDWLHGVVEWEPPQTKVAWREDVTRLAPKKPTPGAKEEPLVSPKQMKELLEAYPLKPLELLVDRTGRVFKQIEKIAKRVPEANAWIVNDDGDCTPTTLGDIAAGKEEALEGMTLILEPKAGGLTENGMLSGGEAFKDGEMRRYDVADEWGDGERRRTWNDTEVAGMRQVFVVNLDEDSEADEPPVYRWFVRPANAADEANSRGARLEQPLEPHLLKVGELAEAIARQLGEAELAAAFGVMGRAHDLGKDRDLWQRSIGNREYPTKKLAKSGGTKGWYTGYRHEFGSLLDVDAIAAFRELEADQSDLARHVVATHHGRGRPHFPADEAFDPAGDDGKSLTLARAVPKRFAALQRKYGRWRLAYLESILRAADYLASEGRA